MRTDYKNPFNLNNLWLKKLCGLATLQAFFSRRFCRFFYIRFNHFNPNSYREHETFVMMNYKFSFLYCKGESCFNSLNFRLKLEILLKPHNSAISKTESSSLLDNNFAALSIRTSIRN